MSNFGLLEKIQAPELNSSTYADNLAEVFDNIDKNFQKLVSVPVIKGDDGSDVQVIDSEIFTDDSLTLIGSKLLNCIYNKEFSEGDSKSSVEESITETYGSAAFDQFNKSNTIKMFAVLNDGVYTEIGVAQYYFFIDGRLNDLSDDNETFVDLSGIFYYQDDEFKNSNMLPTIYYNSTKGTFCWVINGEKTSIESKGTKGQDGEGSKFYNVSGTITGNVITITSYSSSTGEYVEYNDDADILINTGDGVCICYKEDDAEKFSVEVVAVGGYDTSGHKVQPTINMGDRNPMSSTFNKINLESALNNIGISASGALKSLFIPGNNSTYHTISNDVDGNLNITNSDSYQVIEDSGDTNKLNITNYDVNINKADITTLSCSGIIANTVNVTNSLSIENLNSVNITSTNANITNSIQTPNVETDSITMAGNTYTELSVPIGTIVMWYGDKNTVPDKWQICDGTGITPDLRDRFIVGAGKSYTVNSTGGVKTNTLTSANIPRIGVTVDGTITSGSYLKSGSDYGFGQQTSYIGNVSPSAINNLPPYYALYYIMKVSY